MSAAMLRLMRQACFAFSMLGFVAGAQAQDGSFLRRLMTDRLELAVRVTNAEGRPLAGATLWINGGRNLGLAEGRPDLSTMERMAARYASQNDYLGTLDLIRTVFERTNIEGVYREHREESTSDKRYPYILVAVKRGYLPQTVEGVADLNRQHVVTVKLVPDPQAGAIDPRMEELDRLMALARGTQPGENAMSDTRMHRLVEVKQKLQVLAQALEREGKGDEASAVYWALSEYPSVTNTTSADGTRIVGYANSAAGPEANALQLKAIELNTSTPKLLISKMVIAKGFPRHNIRTREHGLAYLGAFSTIANSLKSQQLTPSEYVTAIYQAIRWTTPEEACTLLQRAYRFEPFMMPTKDWWQRLADVRALGARLGLSPQQCLINGLPPA